MDLLFITVCGMVRSGCVCKCPVTCISYSIDLAGLFVDIQPMKNFLVKSERGEEHRN